MTVTTGARVTTSSALRLVRRRPAAAPLRSCASATSAPNSRAIIVAVSVSSVELIVIISRFISSLARTSFTRTSSLSARSLTVMPSASVIVRVTGGGAAGIGGGAGRACSRRWPGGRTLAARSLADTAAADGMPGPLRILPGPRRHAGLLRANRLRRQRTRSARRRPRPTGPDTADAAAPAGRGGRGSAGRAPGVPGCAAPPAAAAGRGGADAGRSARGAGRGTTRGGGRRRQRRRRRRRPLFFDAQTQRRRHDAARRRRLRRGAGGCGAAAARRRLRLGAGGAVDRRRSAAAARSARRRGGGSAARLRLRPARLRTAARLRPAGASTGSGSTGSRLGAASAAARRARRLRRLDQARRRQRRRRRLRRLGRLLRRAPASCPLATGVSAKMSPLGSVMLRCFARRSTNWRATTSSIVLDALFTSMP